MARGSQLACHRLADDGRFPNHPRFPLLLYTGAFRLDRSDPAAAVERHFRHNGWPPAWRDGIYTFHHEPKEAER